MFKSPHIYAILPVFAFIGCAPYYPIFEPEEPKYVYPQEPRYVNPKVGNSDQPFNSNQPVDINNDILSQLGKGDDSFFQVYRKKDLDVTFADIAGAEESKKALESTINYLRDPEAFGRLGAKPPSGILFYGPSGTGKTHLARALAGEVNKVKDGKLNKRRDVTFIVASGASFENKYIGVGADRVRKLFDFARKNKPAIIFIDEFDAVASTRSDEKHNTQVVNQLLTELDGFENKGEKGRGDIFLIAATNNIKNIDPAVRRPGRIDRMVKIDLPNQKNREALLRFYLAREPKITGIDIEALAIKTKDWSAAELATLVNEARIHATDAGASKVGEIDFESAFKRGDMTRKEE